MAFYWTHLAKWGEEVGEKKTSLLGIIRHIQRGRRCARFPKHKHGLVRAARRTQWRRYDAARALWAENSQPLQQSARGVGQANRKSMAIEARRRQSRRRFTARGLFTARAVPCGHRSIQGFKQQEQQADSHTVALDTGARMTHEARRRRRPWRSATPNVGAWMPDETRHRRRPWSTAALNIGAWMTQEHTKKRRGRQRHPSMLETGRQPHCRLAASL